MSINHSHDNLSLLQLELKETVICSINVLIANKNITHHINSIYRKLKHNKSYPINLNVIDEKTNAETHKYVQQYNHQSKFQIVDSINYVLSLFEGNINPGDPMGIKLYLQTTNQIDKEYDKLYISVSNA